MAAAVEAFILNMVLRVVWSRVELLTFVDVVCGVVLVVWWL